MIWNFVRRYYITEGESSKSLDPATENAILPVSVQVLGTFGKTKRPKCLQWKSIMPHFDKSCYGTFAAPLRTLARLYDAGDKQSHRCLFARGTNWFSFERCCQSFLSICVVSESRGYRRRNRRHRWRPIESGCRLHALPFGFNLSTATRPVVPGDSDSLRAVYSIWRPHAQAAKSGVNTVNRPPKIRHRHLADSFRSLICRR